MNTIRKFSKDNSGIAMISVMIICTVCLLIATVVLEITYTSLLSRKVYKAANNTKYTAESTVDDMESVIQNIAYYAVEKKAGASNDTFITVAKNLLMQECGVSAFETQDDYDKLADYIFKNLDTRNQKTLGQAIKDADGHVIGYTRDPDMFTVKAITQSVAQADDTKEALAISVSFKYKDQKGFVSEISTDLVLNDMTVRKAASDYSLGSYSMFTGGGVKFFGNEQAGNKQFSMYYQEGNAYIGTMASEAPKAMEIEGCIVNFSGAVIVNGDIYIQNHGSLILSGGKDDSGARTEVTIKGTIYIDDTSTLTISNDLDFMCKDIIIKSGSNSWSAFDQTKTCYAKKKDTNSYYAMYPFKGANISALKKDGSKTELKGGNMYDDFVNDVGGCVFISDGTYASFAKKTATGFSYLDGGTSGALINRDPNCITEAKSTIWAYDNSAHTVDAEMSTFVNVALLYAQKNIFPNTAMHAQYARILTHDASNTISRTSYPVSMGGSPFDKLTIVTGKPNTNDLLGSMMNASDVQNADGISISSILGKTFRLGENTLNKVVFRVGNVQDCAENLSNDDAAVAFVNVWNAYTVQFNGGSIIGIIMSADKCTYKILGGNKLTTAYSILNAKDTAEETQKTDMDNLIDNLQYCIFMRNVNNTTQHGTGSINTYQNYGCYMLDSLFTGGMKSFTSGGGGSAGDKVSMDSKNMYDFITVENWNQN